MNFKTDDEIKEYLDSLNDTQVKETIDKYFESRGEEFFKYAYKNICGDDKKVINFEKLRDNMLKNIRDKNFWKDNKHSIMYEEKDVLGDL